MSVVRDVIAHYDLPDLLDVKMLGGAGGFSGAQFWKLQTRERDFCLRQWPKVHPDRQRLEWIHLVLVHAFHTDCPFVAVPLESKNGSRIVEAQSRLWEISPWMPGRASFEEGPSVGRLDEAVRSLARFHLASAQVNLDFRKSDNVRSRYRQLRQASELISEIERLGDVTYPASIAKSIGDLRRIVLSDGRSRAEELAGRLEPCLQDVFPVQPVIRDIWHDHLLFTGDTLTGMVDFGAMQMDSVGLDLSRLLGSLLGGRQGAFSDARWDSALATYSTVRQLARQEVELIFVMDGTATLMGSLNWLKWLLIERRKFDSLQQVEKRIQHLIRRQTAT